MKVRLSWGQRNSGGKFRVEGRNLEAVGQALGGLPEWGKFDGNIQYKWDPDGDGKVRVVKLTASFTISMPVWKQYGTQPAGCKEEWDRMWRALEDHENTHRKIFENGLTKVVNDLEALDATAGSEIDAFMERAKEAMQAEQDGYDRETDHGSSRGVELTVSDECRG
jgi:predicted secreted Zn-dependent protease